MEMLLIKAPRVHSAGNSVKVIWVNAQLDFTAMIYNKSINTMAFCFEDETVCSNCFAFCGLKQSVTVDSSSSKKEPAATIRLWNNKLPERRRQTRIIEGHRLPCCRAEQAFAGFAQPEIRLPSQDLADCNFEEKCSLSSASEQWREASNSDGALALLR